ncbi:Auxin response factor [Sesbania bispinosa]|nr:Auxin response factor [Sesbania bispinosa]
MPKFGGVLQFNQVPEIGLAPIEVQALGYGFTWARPSEFVIPLAKYRKVVYGTQVSVGVRFGMMFETEESGKPQIHGHNVGISDVDP